MKWNAKDRKGWEKEGPKDNNKNNNNQPNKRKKLAEKRANLFLFLISLISLITF